jgi:hypothetical protein
MKDPGADAIESDAAVLSGPATDRLLIVRLAVLA